MAASAASIIAVAVPAATELIRIAEQLVGLAHELHNSGGTAVSQEQVAELRKHLADTNARVQAVSFP